jgi:hypothetical protein
LAANTNKLYQVEKELHNAQAEVKMLQKKEAAFRSIILDQASTQKVSDSEIVHGFLQLRQQVQAIASSRSYQVNQILSLSALPRDMHQFYTLQQKLPRKDRLLRMRAQIFKILHASILDHPCFGLEGYRVTEGDRDIEYSLAALENIMENGGGLYT